MKYVEIKAGSFTFKGRLLTEEAPETCRVFEEMLLYPGGISEMELIMAYGRCCFASQHGQLSGNHFLTITEGIEDLEAFGKKVLWEGAQDIEIKLI